MPPGGSPPLQSRGQNHRWPTSGQGGYITPAAWGSPAASERGAESRVALKGARWLHNPCRPEAQSQMSHKWARWLHNRCSLGASPPLHNSGQIQRWPTSGQCGYITPAARGVPHRFTAGGRIRGGPQVGKVATKPLPSGGSAPLQSGGAQSEVAHKRARWLHNPYCLGGPHRFKAGGTIRGGPQVGKVAT